MTLFIMKQRCKIIAEFLFFKKIVKKIIKYIFLFKNQMSKKKSKRYINIKNSFKYNMYKKIFWLHTINR